MFVSDSSVRVRVRPAVRDERSAVVPRPKTSLAFHAEWLEKYENAQKLIHQQFCYNFSAQHR